MTESEAKKQARIDLFARADRARGRMSPAQWEESVEDTPEGAMLGHRELAAISAVVWGKVRGR